MKKTGRCPKCDSDNILTNEGQSKAGDRVSIPVTGWRSMHFAQYICMQCGFLEEYLSRDDLAEEKVQTKLAEKWQRPKLQ